MIKNKKQMYIVIGAFLVVLLLVSTTYAFFNYTRTGSANVIKTGRISFNSEQGTAINLTNMFPIDVTSGIPNDNTKVGTVTLNVTGDTTYDEGIEYLVSAVNVQNSIGSGANAKSLPISIDVSVTNNTTNDPATTLGTSDEDYFDNRGGNSSIYKVLANDTISNNDQLLVGYITKGFAGIDGNIVIKAYLDKSKVAITDTYDGNETDNMGTTTEWVNDRETFTTTEWNSLQASGVSFQIKVEANEGTWVDAPIEPVVAPTLASCPNCQYMAWSENYDNISYNYGENGSTVSDLINDGQQVFTDYHDAYDNRPPYFIGFTTNNGIIDKAYVCGVKGSDPNQGEVLCLGIDDDTTYASQISDLNNFFGPYACSDDFGAQHCYESSDASTYLTCSIDTTWSDDNYIVFSNNTDYQCLVGVDYFKCN